MTDAVGLYTLDNKAQYGSGALPHPRVVEP